MLSQLNSLKVQAEGRYANDSELAFLEDYAKSFNLRLQTYHTLKAAEADIVKQVYQKLREVDSTLLIYSNEDLSKKWKSDTLRVLRYATTALLLDDTETFQERFLFWFQTIMRAFNTERSCDATYAVMQQVVVKHLTPVQASLFCPILELTRRSLGNKTTS